MQCPEQLQLHTAIFLRKGNMASPPKYSALEQQDVEIYMDDFQGMPEHQIYGICH